MLSTGLSAAFLTADIFAKKYVEDNCSFSERRPVLGGRVVIRKMHNKGFALNRMDDRPDTVRNISLMLTVVIVICWLFEMIRGTSGLQRIGVALAAFGAIGNTIDRVRRGYVVDYLQLAKGPSRLRNIVFNLADIMIAAGCVATVAGEIFFGK